MKLALLALFLVACDDDGGQRLAESSPIKAYHDDQRSVTCWLVSSYDAHGVAVSCLPDSSFKTNEQTKHP